MVAPKKGKKKRQGTSSSSSKESRSAQSQGTVKLDPQIEAGWDFFLKIENVLGDISSFEDEYYAFKQGTQSDSEYWKEIINEFVTKADEPELLDHLKSLSFKRFEEKLKAQTLLDRGK